MDENTNPQTDVNTPDEQPQAAPGEGGDDQQAAPGVDENNGGLGQE